MMSNDHRSNSNLDDFAISIELFSWVKENISEGSFVLEFGSGSGTIELCKHYNVYSVEHDEQWIEYCDKSNYIYAPIVDYGSFQWYDREIVKNKVPNDYDLIIVDGPPNNPDTQVIGRHGFIENISMFNTNVPIIFDDVNRDDEYKNMLDAAAVLNKNYEVFEGWQKSFAVVS